MNKGESMKIKNIAVLTSGGDAPGMNSAIFGIFSACQNNGINLYGVYNGFDGLIDNKFRLITFDMLDGRTNRGGSILKSARSKRFKKQSYFKKAISNLNLNKIDALIVIGGDGSTRACIELRDNGIKVISLPGTIDNDLNFTYTIGFDTATNNIVNAVDNIMDSLSTFGYGTVIKLMGRDCPDLVESCAKALHTKYTIMKKDFDIAPLIKSIKKNHDDCHLPPVVLVLEDCIDCNELSKILEEKCKFPFRAHILGYVQRGGSPSAFDRKYGFSAGEYAVDALINGKHGFAVGMVDNSITSKSFEDIIKF